MQVAKNNLDYLLSMFNLNIYKSCSTFYACEIENVSLSKN